MRKHQARRRKLPGPCSGSWPPAKSTAPPSNVALLICRARSAATENGTKNALRPSDFRASFICATMAMRNSFPYGPWRATAISRAPTARPWCIGSKNDNGQMLVQYEDIDGTSPRDWRGKVFRYCDFHGVNIDGLNFEGIIQSSTLTGCRFYWGLFNCALLADVRFV